jgi:hypothetical protein
VTTEFKIEKGVPIPAPTLNGKRGPTPKGAMVASLEVGDSFLFPIEGGPTRTDASRMHALTQSYSRKFGYTYVVRKLEDGMRVWRTA